MFPSPHSGILFLYEEAVPEKDHGYLYVSVPSFGDSFFMTINNEDIHGVVSRFRPLIRGFFFYPNATALTPFSKSLFPSPHSGILFLCPVINNEDLNGTVFPSPHSGILFLFFISSLVAALISSGFRPLIRGFFFYKRR